jgi:hypothetical protein
MNHLVAAIHKLKPNAQFTFKDDDYSTIEWVELDGTAPTQKEIEAALAEVKAEEDAAKAAQEAKKQEVLAKLGLTADEVTALLA